jgi:hypothetical protein
MGSLSSSLAPRWYELDVFAAGKCGQIVPRKLQRDFNAEKELEAAVDHEEERDFN